MKEQYRKDGNMVKEPDKCKTCLGKLMKVCGRCTLKKFVESREGCRKG